MIEYILIAVITIYGNGISSFTVQGFKNQSDCEVAAMIVQGKFRAETLCLRREE